MTSYHDPRACRVVEVVYMVQRGYPKSHQLRALENGQVCSNLSENMQRKTHVGEYCQYNLLDTEYTGKFITNMMTYVMFFHSSLTTSVVPSDLLGNSAEGPRNLVGFE
jgi:hypothetical protein